MIVLDRVFHLSEKNTSLESELAGLLTSCFSTAYIIFVAPGYLSQAGMGYSSVPVAACVASALGCFLSAALSLPFIMTPGVFTGIDFLTENVPDETFTRAKKPQESWQISRFLGDVRAEKAPSRRAAGFMQRFPRAVV